MCIRDRFIHLLKLSLDPNVNKQVRGAAKVVMNEMVKSNLNSDSAHLAYLRSLLSDSESKPDTFKLPSIAKMPPGSPIGCH